MIFKQFESSDIVSGRIALVSQGMWPNGDILWNRFYTSSVQTKITGSNDLVPLNGLYYWNVYQENPQVSQSAAEVYLAVSYGHYAGSGSSTYDINTSQLYPTKNIYNQYKNILLAPNDNKFSFKTGSISNSVSYESDDIYILNFSSDKMKERLDPGQFELTLFSSGSNSKFTLIDDSTINSNGNLGVLNLISGSILKGAYTGSAGTIEGNYKAYGLMYPDVGIIVLNPEALHTYQQVPLPTRGPATNGDYALNHKILWNAINQGASIQARTTEYVPAQHYFIRVKNQEFNYSNNPSFVNTVQTVSGNQKTFYIPSFSTDPRVYITTVGLYNENNDLIAVGKLSQPIEKTFDTEALIKVKLSF